MGGEFGDNALSATSFLPGDVVLTSFGVGVITRCPPSPSADADEKDSKVADNKGDFVASSYQVLLWRIPGKSVASSSVASLQASAIQRRLPVASGMTTTTKQDKTQLLMVHCYYPSRNAYLVSPLGGDDDANDGEICEDQKEGSDVPTLSNESKAEKAKDTTTASPIDMHSSFRRLSRLSLTSGMLSKRNLGIPEDSPAVIAIEEEFRVVSPEELEPAASSKFYPLLQELMRRGDQTAAATNEFLSQKPVADLMEKTSALVENQTEAAKDKLLNTDTPTISEITTSVQEAVPKDEQIQKLLQMIKDEELTVLLEKGKERLEQLMKSDIPQATERALEKTGFKVVVEDEDTHSSPYMDTIHKSRKAALAALDQVLQQADLSNDLDAIRGSLEENFTTMFDSFAQAAKSDRTLGSVFDAVSGKTTEWQEATGRLMSTRAAGLFLEGASRIQARAATLFSKDQVEWAGEVGSKFTKAFTEGDAAVARLKSIELGDKVRNRLVDAIEVRSESLGGLDGIIAGALTTIQKSAGAASDKGDEMKNMLTNLQNQASSVTKDARETLISVLARRSEYRDVALLKVEQVLCDLESHFGDDLSPEDIAAIARGEGGTAKLFEPIAKRAAKEIEKQLDVAEDSVTDPTIVEVLKHVRKIVSGELTLGAVMDEVVNILNDDKVVAAGEELVKHGENVLDAIEGVSGNAVVDEVMQIAEKAGITKDTVMEGIEKLDVNELLDTAGNAMTDESARRELLSNATDTALDFILRILPSMPIPPFDGVKDGLVYHVSNLSMEGFKVRKENIVVEIAGMRATKKKRESSDDTSQTEQNAENAPAWLTGTETDGVGQKAPARLEKTESNDSDDFDFDMSMDGIPDVVKATELLIIDVREISSVFNDAAWSFEQTYLPYLKGSGAVDAKMSDGAIRLVFELRRRRKEKVAAEDSITEFDASEWEPVLCLHDRQCSIGSVEITMQGGTRLAWVVNKLASLFKVALRDYVVRTILSILTDKSGWILSKLNEGLAPYWDIVMKTASLDMQSLEEAGEEDVVEAAPAQDVNLVELVWREQIPLGMNLLLNDESGQLKVVDFPRGSQARTVCDSRNLDPEGFKGATIVAVNGRKYQTDDELFDALRDPGRPKTILFELADTEDAERIRKFVEESTTDGAENPQKDSVSTTQRSFLTRKIEFIEGGEIGIEFSKALDNYGLVVRSFLEGDDGVVLAAARRDDIHEGDLLTHINGHLVLGVDGSGCSRAMELLEADGAKRPLSLSFSEPYMFRATFEKPKAIPLTIGGPSELILEESKSGEAGTRESDIRRIVIKDFNNVDGVAEHSGVLIGDHLVFINGVSVGAGCRWLGEEISPTMDMVNDMLEDPKSYPAGLTFARPRKAAGQSLWNFGGSPRKQEFSMDSAETICVTAESYDQVGCVFDMNSETNEIVVTDFEAVPGPFQAMMQEYKDNQSGGFHLSIESVNGQFVPGYATTQIVSNAMERSWKSENRVELLFCDDERKQWVHSLQTQ